MGALHYYSQPTGGLHLEGSDQIPTVVIGLDTLGCAIARAVGEAPDLRLVGLVDPERAGTRLEALAGTAAAALDVEPEWRAALARAHGGVAIFTQRLGFEEALPHLERAVRAGVSVVTTGAELVHPWLHHEAAAERLDAVCLEADVAVVGVNATSSFALDRLPALLSMACGPVRHVSCTLVGDVEPLGAAMHRAAGIGLSDEAFHAAAESGEVGVAGLSESAMLVGLGCGLEVDEVEEELSPLIAEEPREGLMRLEEGEVAGLQQVVRGFVDGEERVRLDLTLAVEADDPHLEVALEARPSLRARVEGAWLGEGATAWAAVHAAAAVVNLRGLVTALDLPGGR